MNERIIQWSSTFYRNVLIEQSIKNAETQIKTTKKYTYIQHAQKDLTAPPEKTNIIRYFSPKIVTPQYLKASQALWLSRD
ncbi:hypothetical protein GCM10027180_04900 [Microbulbifer echini]